MSNPDTPNKRLQKKQIFANRLVKWQRTHGRHDLPWQKVLDPYRVWVSEIMLQQTQVVTVISYFERFMKRFPSVQSLALAEQDAVLGLWSGLGYYSRARNLHRAAKDVVSLHGGVFPKDYETLQTLAGIGPSTAAAIASICYAERVPILDGNVKRVLTRFKGYAQDLSVASSVKELWSIASESLPLDAKEMPTYTQGIMDLGATLCTPKNPKCNLCPVRSFCVAYQEGDPLQYPVKTKKIKRTTQSLWMLCVVNAQGEVWLEKRPTKGIWAGLYCTPVFLSEELMGEFVTKIHAKHLQFAQPLAHALTHKELILHWVRCDSFSAQALIQASPAELSPGGAWFSQRRWDALGIPAPLRKLLASDVRSKTDR